MIRQVTLPGGDLVSPLPLPIQPGTHRLLAVTGTFNMGGVGPDRQLLLRYVFGGVANVATVPLPTVVPDAATGFITWATRAPSTVLIAGTTYYISTQLPDILLTAQIEVAIVAANPAAGDSMTGLSFLLDDSICREG